MACAVAVATALTLPAAAADAAVRTVTLHYERPQQPQSLNPQPPITQQAEFPQAITVSYDNQAGTLAVHLAIFDAPTWLHRLPSLQLDLSASCDLTADAPSVIAASFRYDRYDGTDENGSPSSEVDARATFTRNGYEGASDGAISPTGDGFDVGFQHPALVGLNDLRCARISYSQTWDASGYFAGYEPFELTKANATAAFKTLLAAKYGSAWSDAARAWALCPREEFFPLADNDDDGEYDDGLPAAICMAQFRHGRTWRYVSGRIEEGQDGAVFEPKPYTREWTRKWRKLPAKCLRQLHLRGTAYSNDGTCPALMISDLAYDVRKGRKPRRAYWHGTNTAGFQTLASYRCTTRARIVTCTNGLGDALRWKG
ncbi:hypothetical protein [Candidatus Solirubrobacter pratensis]|uniref:hypothetical protein n=1 Tax=Candidatus Solirubrobacter pratensis TaxID=1298857 RepID=UPI0003FCCD6B|nr:hypothetical protein [Candidatus Solirubrobacter pratensis]